MIMKFKSVLIAPDKFKGSLNASEFCEIVKKSILKFNSSVEVMCCPLADGGDGSLECFINITNATKIVDTFTNANFKKIKACYALSDKVAFIEMAQTSGLLNTEIKDPRITTTFGVGEQISDAIKRGATKIFLAMGGSATNDAGCGMAAAVGYRFLDKNQKSFIPTGATLKNIKKIVCPDKNLQAEIIALCDVKNKLYGKKGAAYIYAKQKGASDEDIKELDNNLKYFNNLAKIQGFDFQKIQGSGAAGGFGAGAILFLNAKIQSGIETFFILNHIEDKIKKANLIITGEGKIDNQSKFGKVVFELKNRCAKKNFVAFCGVNKIQNAKFRIIEINKPNETLTKAIKNTKMNLSNAVNNFLQEIT